MQNNNRELVHSGMRVAPAWFFMLWIVLQALCGVGAYAEPTASASGEGDLTRLSLQDLANLEVTSVSKVPEGLRRASASVYVITHDDILRSGANSLMEALRLAPNISVTQVSATNYVISARGFSGNPIAQSFSNKLLMLIDGRSVYTPLYSGIYSDAQDVLLEDVDRIEVISGPGATLWGANAMNGVINVITRPSYLTQGTYIDAAAGDRQRELGARYGGQSNGALSYRVYGLGFGRGAEALPDGSSAHDTWSKGQGGFRTDWSSDHDSATLQGDLYRAAEQQIVSFDGSLAGADLLARYQHHGQRSELQVQAFFDQTERFGPPDGGGGAFVLHTYDFEVQQSMEVGGRQRIVWGGGERLNSYRITNQRQLLFEPPHRDLKLGDVFAQDTLSVGSSVALTGGIKLEDDPYSGWTALPDLRASWALTDRATLWAAASKAIRSPTPFDVDVIEKFGSTLALSGDANFRPERVIAYEAGTRLEATASLSMSVTAFYDDYDNLRTVEAFPGGFFPLRWDNLLRGHTYGLEAWGNWQAAAWWRLSPGFRILHEHLRFKPGASGIVGTTQAGDDPSASAELTSSMDLSRRFVLDATLRYAGALPNPALPHYCELNGRLAWRATDSLDLSVNGLNLLHARHYEFPSSAGSEGIYRSVSAEARWRF